MAERQDSPGEAPGPRFVLRLYVTGGSARSAWAIRNVRRLCEGRLAGLSDLSIIDIYQQPALARDAELVAAPTLVKERPPPRRRFVGTMCDLGPLLADLGLESASEVTMDSVPRDGRAGSAMSETGSFVIHDLVLPIAEAHETLCAIRNGEVDALVVAADGRQQVFILKGADQAHRILLETLNEGAATIAADATVLYANRRLAELLGHPLERVLGATLTLFVDADDVGRFAAVLAEAARGRGKGEIRLVSAGGDPVPVMLSMSALGEGPDESYTVVVTDLTRLKQAQVALERANDELEARVEARTRELSAANEALLLEIAQRTRLEDELRANAATLIEADRRKDEFLSMLGHELRNPLAPILAAAEMIRVAMEGRSDLPKVERYQAVIARQVRHLARLVDDLLDVSRITRDNVTLKKQPVELAAMVRSALEATRPSIDKHHHHLRVALPGEPLWLVADATRCEQVLVNLLNNAAKFTERGGNITLSAKPDGGEVVISVRDDGIGIPPDLLPRVFDLFVQGECSLDRAQGGLGIGLTLVKRLVEMHGGTVEARSEGKGRGSEMVVRLPLAAEARAATESADPADPSEGPPPSRRRVLVMEDNADMAQTLTDLVELWGHVVARASNGEDALRMASAFQPDVVLMDIGLPGMDGYEVARRLRQGHRPMPEGAPPVLVGITGYGQARDLSRAQDAGFDHYLIKPPNPATLQVLLASGPDEESSRGVRSSTPGSPPR